VAGTTGTTSPTPAPPAGTSGTTASAGKATIDPAIKTKLEEFRKHLTAFNAAAGGVPQL
jgi:hypothetical protein